MVSFITGLQKLFIGNGNSFIHKWSINSLETGIYFTIGLLKVDDYLITRKEGSKFMKELIYLILKHSQSGCCSVYDMPEFLKVGILGSRIPDIISEKFGHFWLKP